MDIEKRIALLRDGVVFNLIIGPSAEEMATLFNCQAVEVTAETKNATIGYPFVDGVFEQPLLVLNIPSDPGPTEE
jgi:hypothetical protein